MVSSGDSFYVPSEGDSFMMAFHTPPQTPPKARKMIVEVVIPVPKPAKKCAPSPVDEDIESTTRRPERIRPRDLSPARSDSSVSLGTYWHISPKKKRKWTRKKRDPVPVEQGEPPKRRYARRGRGRPRIQPGREEHTTTPISLDSPAPPRFAPIVPSKPRSQLTSSVPGMRINLDSARLETIQAQESARGYDIDHHWLTPDSGSIKGRIGHALNTPTTSSYSEPRKHLYAFNDAGSSTGLGTLERDKILGEQSWAFGTSATTPQKSSIYLNNLIRPTLLIDDWRHPTFAGRLEEELDTVSPEMFKLARLGLRTALEKLVEQYDFPLSNVSKLYHSKGSLEETERVLKQLKRTEDELKSMKHAAFGNQ